MHDSANGFVPDPSRPALMEAADDPDAAPMTRAGRKPRSPLMVLGLALAVLVAIAAAGAGILRLGLNEGPPPDFSVPTTANETFVLSEHRGQVVVLEFFGTTCAPCQIVEADLKQVAPTWNASQVIVLSVAVWGESLEELRAYQEEHAIPWTVAQNTDDVNVKYNVYDIPHVVILDQKGELVFQQKGYGITGDKIADAVAATLAGTGMTRPLVHYGIVGLAVLAGGAAFFSPCAIGMLPAYVAHATRPISGAARASSRLRVGALSALGVLIVFFAIGALAFALGPALTVHVPLLQPLVGAILIVLGALFLVHPYSVIVQRAVAPITAWASRRQQTRGPMGFFAYGVGYGAAAAGCTTPVLLSVILLAAASGPLLGAGIVFAYAATGAFLMVLLTLVASFFGEGLGPWLGRHARKVEAFTAITFILGGVFLVAYAVRAGTLFA